MLNMKSKKGAEIALNVIIVAVIGLLVLAIVIYIFAGKTQLFTSGSEACSTKQGTCIDITEPCSGPIQPAKDCDERDPPMKCCVKIAK